MYDPNNPTTPPPGGFSITSAPGGSPSIPGGGRPGAPPMGYPPAPTKAPQTPNPNKGPGLSPGGVPPLPGGGGMPQVPGFPSGGGLTPGGMPPIPSAGNLAGAGTGMGRGPWEMGDMADKADYQRTFNRDALRNYLEQFRNSIFQWIAARPSDPSQMQAWIAQRPQFSRESMMASMFAPTAPATGTTPAPTPPPPTL